MCSCRRIDRTGKSQSLCAGVQNLRLPFWAAWTLRMCCTCWDSSRQMQECGRGVFVSRNWIAEANIPKVLQGIGNCVVRWISYLPQPVTFGKLLRRQRCQPKQIVRAVFNHVDAEVIAGINAEIGPFAIAQR